MRLYLTLFDWWKDQDLLLFLRASHDYEAERKQREETINKLQHNLNELLSQQKVREHELEQFRGDIVKNKSDLATVEKQLNMSVTKS